MISIILPVYHVEDYIEQCLNSLINQTYRDIEIICINDCTMDNSITIVKEYQKKDKRIRLINHHTNKGLGGARNTGIKEARGEYILFVDSDDYIDHSMVDLLHTALCSAKCDAAVCGIMLTYDTTKACTSHTAFHYDNLAAEKIYHIETDKTILTDMWPSVCNKLWKRSIISENNILFKERILYEDHTFFYEYFSKCSSFIYINKPLYFYRKERPQSITTHSTGREKEIFKILEYIGHIFKSMYSDEIYLKLYLKIVIRLLYERRWIFADNDPNYYTYLHKVSNYLSHWEKEQLLEYKDSFIEKTDPVFYTSSEINLLQKRNMKQRCTKCFSFKHSLGKLPILKQLRNFRQQCITLKKDFYWYCYNIHQTNLEMQKTLDGIILSDQSEKLQKEIVNAHQIFLESLKSIHLEERLSDMELSLNSYKKKMEDVWWLSWNIKDHLNDQKNNIEIPDPEKYYPTWIPCEFPVYFQGNTWYWADKFKDYHISHNSDCANELETLFYNLKSSDIQYLKILWERNTQMLPRSAYTEKHGFLLNKNLVFTKQELSEQEIILRSYQKIIEQYILPDQIVYEIPVFYYEHGLKYMKKDILEYIYDGDILDLGGFIGDSAVILSKYTGNTVFTVELNQDNLKIMETVISANHVSHKVQAILGAVSDRDTEQVYYGSGSSSTLYDINNNTLYTEAQKVAVYKVDTLVSSYNIHPRFMKLDVEGMEYKTIAGSRETITKYKPVLCISIYHTPIDFLKIKPLIESWNLGYTFHIENHNPFDPVYEKMLICIPQII